MKIKIILIMTCIFFSIFSTYKSAHVNETEKSLHIMTYKVQPYETIQSISEKFGVSEYTLQTSNNLYSRRLRKGQVLYIPNADVTLYRIPKGKWTLQRLAYKFYIRSKDIVIFDRNLEPLKIVDNQERIPYMSFAAVPQLSEDKYIMPFEGSQFITSGWGYRKLWGVREWHNGADFAMRYEKVLAVKSGRVIFAGWYGNYGRCIIIQHTNGEKSLYAHLSRYKVRKSAYVHQGMVIAISGNTGRSSGPHIHLSLFKNDKAYNPFKVFYPGEISKKGVKI